MSKTITAEDLAIGVLVVIGGAAILMKTASASSGKTGLYLPIYSPPMRTESEPANLTLTGSPNLFTANPNNGPFNPDGRTFATPATRPDVAANAKKLKTDNSACHVLGYVATGYAVKLEALIKAEVDAWAAWNIGQKLIDGIMWDETMADAQFYDFYKRITDYARSKGLAYIRGNPGAKPTDERFIQLFDTTSIKEGNTLVTESQLRDLTYNGKYPKSKFNYIAHSVAMDDAWFNMAIKYVGSIYLTDDTAANPYDQPASYLNREVALLKGQP